MKIQGSLYVTHNNWRYVYNAILNFFNQEINVAYTQALNFYEENNTLNYDDFLKKLNTFFSETEITNYRKDLIKNSLIKNNRKITKPKKNMFTSYTNRTGYIHTSDVNVDFDKVKRTIVLETAVFDDFDNFMANNAFITEFINMVTTINWPTRFGPNKTIKGCTLLKKDVYNNTLVFFQAGPNPPQYESPTEVVSPPNFINSSIARTIKFTSTTTEETSQPLPTPTDLRNI